MTNLQTADMGLIEHLQAELKSARQANAILGDHLKALQTASPPIPTKEELWPIVKEWWDGYDADVDSEVDELTKKIHALLTALLKGAPHE